MLIVEVVEDVPTGLNPKMIKNKIGRYTVLLMFDLILVAKSRRPTLKTKHGVILGEKMMGYLTTGQCQLKINKNVAITLKEQRGVQEIGEYKGR